MTDSDRNYNEWYKLDNAAKIFPAVSTDRNSNIFRLSAYLYEEVNPDVLQQALIKIMPRFPSFAAKLRRGFFWYFLDHNANVPIVRQEPYFLYRKIQPDEERGFLFRVFYFGKRISIEMFHTLSDGFGGFEFLKSLLFHYLELKGYPVKAQDKIRTANSPYRLKELEDSFFINYEKSSLAAMKDETAYTIPGVPFLQEGSGLITGECNASEMNALAKSMGATLGEFVTAVYINSIIVSRPDTVNSKRPIIIFVPVNLRRFFNSETLRNFSNFTKVRVHTYKKIPSFEEILQSVKDQMAAQLKKDVLTKRMSGGVSAEKILFFRLVPLFLKIPVLKFFYRKLGERLTTTSISNMGRLELPESMVKYVDKLDLSTGAGSFTRINVALGSYNNKLVISFSRSIMETDIIRAFFTFFEGRIPFKVESNSWEEDNFIPEKILSGIKREKKLADKAEKRTLKQLNAEQKKMAKEPLKTDNEESPVKEVDK